MGDNEIKWVLIEGKTESFYISATTITFSQYDEYCDSTGTEKPEAPFGRDNQPVVNVSVIDAINYCQWLSKATERTIRLPEETEWVWASRGGSNSQYYEYAGSNNIDDVAWYGNNSGNRAHPVGLKQPNELGIYDMSGNVWELVGTKGMLVGGAFDMDAIDCQISHNIRGKCEPDFRYEATGFRVIRTV